MTCINPFQICLELFYYFWKLKNTKSNVLDISSEVHLVKPTHSIHIYLSSFLFQKKNLNNNLYFPPHKWWGILTSCCHYIFIYNKYIIVFTIS